jgi:syntaxin-binding protein 5
MFQYQPNRVLITHHFNLTVQFSDMSAQLLLGLRPTPIQNHFPNPLVDLNIDLKPLLVDPSVSKRTSATFFEQARIDFVRFATESLETAVVFKTGEVVVYRMSGPKDPALFREAADEELVILEHVPKPRNRRFSSYFMLLPRRGPAESCVLSDIGKFAIH